MEFKVSSAALAQAMGATVAVMAQSSFNFIGNAAVMLVVGVYVDKAKLADVVKSIETASADLGYGRSSKFALVAAAKDVARKWLKDKGAPDRESPDAFWQTLADCDNAPDMVAFAVASIKADFNVNTVKELSDVLKGAPAPKAESTHADKAIKALEGASPEDTAKVAMATVAALAPSDAAKVMLNLASKLTLDQLNDVLTSLVQMATNMAEAQAAEVAPEAEKAAA